MKFYSYIFNMSSAVSGMSLINGIPILCNREGYTVWKFKMRMLLIHEGLWETISAVVVEGKKTPDDVRKDEKALSKICLTVDGAAISIVRPAKTAKEAWDALMKSYEDRSLGRKLSLERKLYRYSLSDFSDLEAYLTAITTTALDLADIGKTIEDSSVAAIILGGLTSRYEPLIMALENGSVEVTTDLVRTKLLSEMTKETKDDVAALHTNKQVICFRCKKPGHKSPNCPIKKKEKKAKASCSTEGCCKDKGLIAFSSGNMDACITEFVLDGVTELALSAPSVQMSEKWIIDSGASTHMTPHAEWFDSYRPCDGKITVANGSSLPAVGLGDVAIDTKTDFKKIFNVVHVPGLDCNLLSVKKAVEKGLSIVFDINGCNFYNSNDISFRNNPVLHGSVCGGLYTLDCTIKPQGVSAYNVHTNLSQFQLWHKRLGHLCRIGMDLLKKGLAVGVEYTEVDKEPCVPCVEGKQARKPFKAIKYKKATSPLELVHTDVCGPLTTESFKGNKYFIIFVDDYTRFISLYCMSTKTEVQKYFCAFQALVERQTGTKIRTFRSDNGTEYVNKGLTDYLQAQGIRHETSVPYSPQQNGVSERCNRSIVEKARSLLAQSSLSKAFWQDAVETSVYLKNRSPHRALDGKTPYEMWCGSMPDLSHLRVFGCRALVHVPSCQRTKLDMKASEHIFVGYSDDPRSYYFRSAENPRRLIKSRDITFFENNFSGLKDKSVQPKIDVSPNVSNLFSQTSSDTTSPQEISISSTSTSSPTSEGVDMEVEQVDVFVDADDEVGGIVDTESLHSGEQRDLSLVPLDEPIDVCPERRYPERVRKPPDYYSYGIHGVDLLCDDPNSYREAINSDDKDNWISAMKDEYNALLNKQTWTLVDKPNKKVIPCKWVFKIKRDANGAIVKYKARLVAKGFSQVWGTDYNETFAPVVRNSSLRTLIALAAEMDLKILHMDVDTAFLNGDLEEEVYMQQPEGFAEHGAEGKVCLLRKSIYGLKQAARTWNIKLHQTLSKIGFARTSAESCVYLKKFGNETIILAVYVDDLIVFYKEKSSVDAVKNDLKIFFSFKDLGALSYCLGLNINRVADKIVVSQKTYIQAVLERFNMQDCKEMSTPLENNKLEKGNPTSLGEYPYQNLIGCLMYLAVNTRPDIAYATSYLSQFNNCYDKTHWLAAKRVLQYLKGTMDYCITYRKVGRRLYGYTDADWANCVHDRRSYTGYYFTLAGGPISWECKKQPTVALSSTEAEYMSLTSAAKEAIFLRRLVCDITGFADRVLLYNDSQSAQKLVLNPIHHNRTKHIDTRYHFIREKVTEGLIDIKFIPTDKMTADVLTKPLRRVAHHRCVVNMGLMINR